MQFIQLSTLSALLLFFTGTAALPHYTRGDPSQPLTVRNITQFPNTTFVENLAIRSNGQALVTLLSTPELFLVDPEKGGEPQLVHKFAGVTGLSGIAEIEDDVFAVVAGNLSLATFQGTQASFSVWKVDMRSFKSKKDTSCSQANITQIAGIPQATFLNGMITLDKTSNVLIADSAAGVVWRLDTNTGESQVVIDDPLMKAPAGGPAVGINGIGTFNQSLYFTNSFGLSFNRVPIDSNGKASGTAQTVAKCEICDDFTFDQKGNALVTQNPGNILRKITPEGVSTVLVGGLNSTELAGPSSARFGRKNGKGKGKGKGGSVLYLTTCGGLVSPVNGTFVEGGKVVAIDLQD